MGPLVHPTNRDRFTACPSVRLSVRPSGEVSGHLPENAWRKLPEILHADVSWPPSELISLWPRSVNFSNFGTILTRVKLGFPGISWRTHGGNGLKYRMLLYPDHLQNWLDYGYGLVIFFFNFGAILTQWKGSNLGFPGIFWKTHWGSGLKFCMLIYPDHFQNWLDYS